MNPINFSKQQNKAIARENVPQKYLEQYDSIASEGGNRKTIDTDIEKNIFADYIRKEVEKGLLEEKDYEKITGFKYLNRERFKEIEQELSKKPSVNNKEPVNKELIKKKDIIKIFKGCTKPQ